MRPRLLILCALVCAGLLAPASAQAKLRCSSGTTQFTQGPVRMFYVARLDTYYVCSARLRRPRLVYEAEPVVQPPASVVRFGRHLTFWMTAIGGAGSGTDYCWVNLVTAARRCASMDDELAMADRVAVRDDGAMAMLLQTFDDTPGELLFFRNGRKRFGRPVVLGHVGVPGKLKALGLTDTAVTWTGPDGQPGQLSLTARCPKTECDLVGREREIDVTSRP